MAVRSVPTPFDLSVFPDEPLVDPSRTLSGTQADGTPEINLGAFRGLAFALVFEAVLSLVGAIAWEISRTLH